ncbi:MAG: hypothetical protein Q9174_001716 [Haloplaca sp. 1 TL-2023]
MSAATPTDTIMASTKEEPTPSPLPIRSEPISKPAAPRPHPEPGYPTCKLRVECHDLAHRGAQIFFDNINVSHDLAAAVSAVLETLYKPSPSNSHIPPVRSVTFILHDMEGLAYTRGTELDNDHKEIHMNLDYITKIPSKPSSLRRHELQGVMTHEMVHCWQWNGKGSAPGGFIEGIADFVRLRAGLAPPHWKRQRVGRWDAGYQNTGYFLDWIENMYGEDSVKRMNEALMNKRYDETTFWMNLFGKNVQELWDEYCKTLPDEVKGPEAKKSQGGNEATAEHQGSEVKDRLEKIME